MKFIIHSGVSTSKFIQETPAATWTINHGLCKILLFDVVADIDGAKEVIHPLDVEYSLDLNIIYIRFSKPYSGFVTLIDLDN